MGQQESREEIKRQMVALKEDIEKTRREMVYVASRMERVKRQEHISELLRAGSVIEEAGILGLYNKNLLYLLLVINRSFLCKHDYAVSGDARFDMMHGLDGLDE